MSRKEEMLAMVNQIADKNQKEKDEKYNLFLKDVKTQKRKIKKYAKRIADMCEIANSMVLRGIEIPMQFATDGWSHNFGFTCNRGYMLSSGVTGVGIQGGGYSYEDFAVDTKGNIISKITEETWDRSLKYKSEEMCESFDAFENKFFQYIKELSSK